MSSWFTVRKEVDEVVSTIERLYVLEMIVDDKVVYKIGKASGKNCKQRMLQIVASYFDVYRVTPVVKIVKDKACTEVFTKETKCHQALVEHRFRPEKKFSGCTELFCVDKKVVLDVYKRILES